MANGYSSQTNFDTIIIGGGISGINSAYRLQEAFPNESYAILEGRHEVGGTWSLFKYPGTRSDSDLYTFGFAFDPWPNDQAVATAPEIVSYMKGVCSRHGIDKHIHYHHMVRSLDWSSRSQTWRIDVLVDGIESKIFHAKRVVMGTGYYDYKEGLKSTIEGVDDFEGRLVHPQFWPSDLDYKNKKVVVIGSGATAITLVPAMCDGASSVTMLQRSPGYIRQLPLLNRVNQYIRKFLPGSIAFRIIRLRALLSEYAFFYFCRLFPQRAINFIEKTSRAGLPENIKLDPHFKPKYLPWDQRMCVSPDGDLFKALRTGKADIMTDTIDRITKKGIQLTSGQFLPADVIVTATGLKMQMFGNATVSVDGEPVVISDKFIWRGVMLQDCPNLAMISGYMNISWTLGADASIKAFVRLMKELKKENKTTATPSISSKDNVQQAMPNGLTSNYLKVAFLNKKTPKIAKSYPWRAKSNYFADSWFAMRGNLRDGLTFT